MFYYRFYKRGFFMLQPRPIDLICCHAIDGGITPLRIRVKDEDGQYQAYAVREYRDLSHQGTRFMPDGVYVSDNTLIFECKILVFGREKKVRLYSNDPYLSWVMTP